MKLSEYTKLGSLKIEPQLGFRPEVSFPFLGNYRPFGHVLDFLRFSFGTDRVVRG